MAGATWLDPIDLVEGNGNSMDTADTTEVGSFRPFNHSWWTYTPTDDGSITVDTWQSVTSNYDNADTVIQVYNQTDEPGDLSTSYIARNDDSTDGHEGYLSQLSFGVTSGVTYRILVGTYGTAPYITTYVLNFHFAITGAEYDAWVDLPLEDANIHQAPAGSGSLEGVPWGIWDGTSMNTNYYDPYQLGPTFTHPLVVFGDTWPTNAYRIELEVTYLDEDSMRVLDLDTNSNNTDTAWWNDPTSYRLFFDGPSVNPFVVHAGPSEGYSGWGLAVAAGHTGITFEFNSGAKVASMRYRLDIPDPPDHYRRTNSVATAWSVRAEYEHGNYAARANFWR